MEPEKESIEDYIVPNDDVEDVQSNFIETKKYSQITDLREKMRNFRSRKAKPGYLDMNLVFSGNAKKHPVFRFKSLSRQEDDFFNRDSHTSDPNSPLKEIEMLRKENLSNGVLIIDRKRTCNFETGKYPSYYLDLRKD